MTDPVCDRIAISHCAGPDVAKRRNDNDSNNNRFNYHNNESGFELTVSNARRCASQLRSHMPPRLSVTDPWVVGQFEMATFQRPVEPLNSLREVQSGRSPEILRDSVARPSLVGSAL